MANGADVLCDTFLLNGIDTCFANPGTSEMHFVAALDRKPEMRCILGLFEGVVTGAADGYARMAGKPAATLLHTGPGLANALANMHNAKRAFVPMINVVGDHASYHLPNDAALTSDIESLARPMSCHVRRIYGPDDVSRATAESIAAASAGPGGVSTLILPADASWSEVSAPADLVRAEWRNPPQADQRSVREVADAIRGGGKTLLLLAGDALTGPSLKKGAAIAEKIGGRIAAEQTNRRIERGAGRPSVDRIPYVMQHAQAFFADVDTLVLVGSKAPVAFFAYPDTPTKPVSPGTLIVRLAERSDDLGGALDLLGQELGLADAAAWDGGRDELPPMPSGALTPDAALIAVSHHLPENAVIADEAVTSGREFFKLSHGAAPHDHIQVAGGAIGGGLPLAFGAAIGAPDRKIVCLQADGSGMYTNQALWSMARENADVCVVIFANRRYAILLGELKNVKAGEPGRNANRILSFDEPAIDWVGMANSMGVDAARCSRVEEFADVFKSAMGRRGPFLIEAVI